MARVPMLYDLTDMDKEFEPLFFHDDSFGFGLMPEYLRALRRCREAMYGNNDLLTLAKQLDDLKRFNNRRLTAGISRGGNEQPICQIGKDGFQACMDVSQFKPNELNVKVSGNSIIVEGNHEEREDPHGHISRHFKRRYTLPKGYDPNSVVSTLSSDGVLTVAAPKPQLENKQDERMITIQQTGPAHLNVKENAQEKVGDSKTDVKPKK